MAHYRLSRKADEDVVDIYRYSCRQFGEAQADAYLAGLEEQLLQLAASPETGLRADMIREGYWRAIYVSHVLYYRKISKGIEVVRILHGAMEPSQHL